MASVRRLQVEGDASFGRVIVPEGQAALRMGNIVKEWPHAADRLATGGFDLDDIGPQVAQEFATELALFVGEIQDSQARQRAWEGLGIGHCNISSIYGKRLRVMGQNVPSA